MGSNPDLRFGIAIPQRFTGEIDVAVLPPFFAAVEELGYHSCWVVEQAINAHNDLAPIPLLSYAAALTTTARLGSSVLISVLRNPINLAKSLATLDRLSNGRLIAGVGMGNATGAPFSEAFGAPAAGKAARFEEGLVLMQRLWTGERVTFEGRFWQLDDCFISPTPVQERIPLWFGGHAPAALDRAARLGDGWMGAGATSTARFREEQEAMRAHLDAHGRDPATFTHRSVCSSAWRTTRRRRCGACSPGSRCTPAADSAPSASASMERPSSAPKASRRSPTPASVSSPSTPSTTTSGRPAASPGEVLPLMGFSL